MKAGDLRHRITIQCPARSKDAHGRIVSEWQPLCEIYAAVRNVSAREFFAAAAVHMEDVVTFSIRWRSDIDSSMRIIFRGNAYGIMEVNHLSYQGDYMTIKARLVAPEV